MAAQMVFAIKDLRGLLIEQLDLVSLSRLARTNRAFYREIASIGDYQKIKARYQIMEKYSPTKPKLWDLCHETYTVQLVAWHLKAKPAITATNMMFVAICRARQFSLGQMIVHNIRKYSDYNHDILIGIATLAGWNEMVIWLKEQK